VATFTRSKSARAPEVLQTSEMDCGPAALAALLGAFGIDADLGALREVCATDVDGTSIDVLEEVAVGLGVDAQQVVVPWEQLRAAPELYLPALLLTRTPGGLAHVVCAWRHRRGRVDLVDPAVGRRRVRWANLADEVFVHELEAPTEAWEEYAFSTDARVAFEARLRAGGASRDEARTEVETARQGGALEGGIGGLLSRLDDAERNSSESGAPSIGPGAEPGTVKVRGVVLVRAKGVSEGDTEIAAPLQRVLAGRREQPLAALRRWIGLRRAGTLLALLTGLLAAVAGVGEVLLGREVLEQGVGGGRLLALAAVLAASILVGGAFALQVAAIGRRVENGIFEDLLGRAGRLGEVFSRTRPAGDLAERTHALRELREAIELAGLGVQKGLELLLACVAIVVLAPAAWPAAVLLLAFGILAPAAIVRTLREADLRSRAQGGALAQLLTDVLGGSGGIQAHRAAPVVAAWQVPILGHWKAAATDLARRSVLATVLLSAPSLLLAVGATALATAAGAGSATAFAVLALGFTAAAGTADIAFSTRRLVSLRSVIARLLDALNAPLVDPPAEVPAAGGGGATLDLRGVDVVLGGVPVLRGLDLSLVAGGHVAVVGASGAGKSTLVALLGGWLKPAAGTMTVDGAALEGEALARLRAGTAWSDPTARLRDATALENADEGGYPGAPSAAERLAAVGLAAELLSGEGIGEAGSRLSGSEAQRLRLARALGRPDARLVLLDEALRGLPEDERRALLGRLREVWGSATLLHVTHDPAEALGFDRVLVVADGRLAEDGDPGTLATRPGGRFRALLEAQQSIRLRLEDRERWEPVADLPPIPGAGPDGTEGRGTAPAPAPRVLPLLGVSLAAALVATGLLFLAAAALGDGLGSADPGGLGWLPGVVGLLVASAAATAVGLVADGRLTVAVGEFLRRRALTAQLASDPDRRRAEGIGARLGRVLDLEAVERAVQGAGAVLAVGLAELVGATVALMLMLDPVALLPVVAGIGAGGVLALLIARDGRAENAARRELGTELLHLLLGYRAATIFASPENLERAKTGIIRLRAQEARGDGARALLATALPRLVALALLGLLALDPPATSGGIAAALGAILLALTGLERTALAVADLAIAAPAWSEARPLLQPAPGPREEAGPRDLVEASNGSGALRAVRRPGVADASMSASIAPPPGEDVLFHRSLASNALLATRTWPPEEGQLEELTEILAPLGLAAVVGRMPSGLGQPLGETGWRLSEGERARFSLLRALLARPATVILDDTLSALDVQTAHRVLDHLESLDAGVILLRREADGASAPGTARATPGVALD
jgi:ABC-type bacteriocin/lantibiotic exporter with double-glycine peptidase domain